MTIESAQINDVKLIRPRIFSDNRGYFSETWRASACNELLPGIDFVQDNISKSKKGVLRGLHYQIEQPQAKLVMCLQGSVLDVAVDLRRHSPTFGQFVSAELTEQNGTQIFVPVGFAHGFLVTSETATVLYKCSDYYNPSGERGIIWNDINIGIDWSIDEPIISEKDAILPSLETINPIDLFT